MVPAEQQRLDLDAGLPDGAGHIARQGAGLDGQVDDLGLQVQRTVQPPRTRSHHGDRQDDQGQEETGNEAPHGCRTVPEGQVGGMRG